MIRNRYLDFLKGFLIIAVVLGHVLQIVYYRGDPKFFSDVIFKAIYMWHMPLFMAVSGYLSWPGIQRDSVKKLGWSRFKSYLVPVFSWSLLFTIFHFCLNPGITLLQFGKFWSQGSVGDFWFLWALFFSTLLVGLARLVAPRFKAAYVVLPALMLLVPDVWHFNLIKYVMPFFLLGCLVAEYGVPDLIKENRGAALIISGIASIVCFWAWRDDTYVYLSGSAFQFFNATNLVLRYSSGLCSSVAVLLIVRTLWERMPKSIDDKVEILGQDSIYIYLVQGYVLTIGASILRRYTMPHLNIYWRGITTLAVALIICGALWAISAIIARNRILSQLLFGKRKTLPPRSTEINKPVIVETV